MGVSAVLVGALIVTACGGGAPDDGNRAVASGPAQREAEPAEQAVGQRVESVERQAAEQDDVDPLKLCTCAEEESTEQPQEQAAEQAAEPAEAQPEEQTADESFRWTPRESSRFIDFETLAVNAAQVPDIAWNDSQRILSANAHLTPTVQVHTKVGPTTDLYFTDYAEAFDRAVQFWAAVDNPTEYIVLLYNFADLPWAIDELTDLGLDGQSALGPCTPVTCTGANSGVHTVEGVAVGVFGIDPADSWDPYRYGPLQIHEYTHTVQPAPWIGGGNHPQRSVNRSVPCWLMEGQANFVGVSVWSTDYDQYIALRTGAIFGHRPGNFGASSNDYSVESILMYYENSVPGVCIGKDDYNLGYSIGLVTMEALSSIAGSDSSMFLMKSIRTGATFEESFQLIYGTSWDDAKPFLASYVSAVYNELFKR